MLFVRSTLTTTTNTINMFMRKKMIIRIPDAYLRFKKPNFKIVDDMSKKNILRF